MQVGRALQRLGGLTKRHSESVTLEFSAVSEGWLPLGYCLRNPVS